MNRMINFFSQVNEWIGKAVSWLTLGLVVLTCGDVLFRYSFSKTQAWVMELEWHLFALIFLFGAGYALKHDRHVRVDLFYSRFSEKKQSTGRLCRDSHSACPLVYHAYLVLLGLCTNLLDDSGRISGSWRFTCSLPDQVCDSTGDRSTLIASLFQAVDFLAELARQGSKLIGYGGVGFAFIP
jgi:hypothetical protein